MLARTVFAARQAAIVTVPSARTSAAALFSTSARAMAEGDTGAPHAQGGQGDAFRKREKANEDYVIRQREQERLHALKKKLDEQQEHLHTLRKHIEQIEKEQGGEQN